MADARIVVVEDEQIVSKDIQAQLKRFGYEVVGSAASGEDAVALVGETQPDLVLMDVMLKGEMMGTEATEQIRDQFGIPVIYLTAYADKATLDRAKITDAYGYVLKPFDERELQTAIEMALYKHRSEQEKMRLKEQLMQSQKLEAIGHLTTGVAHNFNNALNVIVGNLELAQRTANPETVPYLKRAQQASVNAAQVVEGLAAFCRPQPAREEVFDACDVVRQATDMCDQTLKGEIGLMISTSDSPCPVRGDAHQILQAVLNLCLNARDAIEEGGEDIRLPRILVAVDQAHKEEGAFACIAVKDNGVGMTADVQEHIFEPFFTTKPVDKGTGLGLATAYGVVQSHGGWIECDSTPGEGTTFVVNLPLDEAAAAVSESLDTETPEPAPAKELPVYSETLLIVDDEDIVRETARDLLELLGYHIIEAADGQAAWEIYQAKQDQIDLVLLDISMPGMSGLALLERLLAFDPGVRAIIMTGNMPEDTHAPGARAVLGKPLMPRVMFETVRNVLDNEV